MRSGSRDQFSQLVPRRQRVVARAACLTAFVGVEALALTSAWLTQGGRGRLWLAVLALVVPAATFTWVTRWSRRWLVRRALDTPRLPLSPLGTAAGSRPAFRDGCG